MTMAYAGVLFRAGDAVFLYSILCQNASDHHSLKVRRMPTKQSVVISGLALALLVTNGMWAQRFMTQDLAFTNLEHQLDDTTVLLDQALSVLPVAADEDAPQEEVIAAAQRAGATMVPYEREGFIWVEHLGMRFGDDGRLVSVTTGGNALPTEPARAEDVRLEGGIIAGQGHALTESI